MNRVTRERPKVDRIACPHRIAVRTIRLILLDGRTPSDPLVAQALGGLVVYAGVALVAGRPLLQPGLRRAERTGGFSVVG